jgi:hypothetical protein
MKERRGKGSARARTSIHDRLFVDDDIACICFRSRDTGSDRRAVRFEDDPAVGLD